MNPIDPGAVPPEELPAEPGAVPPNPLVPQSKPWEKPQPPPAQQTDPGTTAMDGIAVVDVGVQGASLGADLIGGAADVVGAVAGGAIEAAGEVAGSAIEGAGSALEAAGGCAEGCGGCSLAVLVTLFAAAGSAMAYFR